MIVPSVDSDQCPAPPLLLVCRIDKREKQVMDKDRIGGAAKQAKGAVKEAAGKVLGDAKLTAEGKSDKVEGKIQNAIGGLKDTLKK